MKTIPLLTLLLALAACGETTTARPVEWYKANEAERNVMLAKCKDNPGGTALTADCLNAQAAQHQLDGARKGYAPLPARI